MVGKAIREKEKPNSEEKTTGDITMTGAVVLRTTGTNLRPGITKGGTSAHNDNEEELPPGKPPKKAKRSSNVHDKGKCAR